MKSKKISRCSISAHFATSSCFGWVWVPRKQGNWQPQGESNSSTKHEKLVS